MTRQAVTGSLSAFLLALGATFLLVNSPRLFGAEFPVAKDPRLYDPRAGKPVQSGPDAAVTELEFLPENGVVRREVRLKALIANRGEETLRNVKVRFEAGGKLIAEAAVRSLAPGQSRPARATWIPATPGESQVTVTVDPDNSLGDIDRSNNIRLRTVQIRPQPVDAAIDPNPLEVTQGEQASFVAKVALPSGRASNDSLIHRWRGPAGRTGADAVFRVDTADLQPGRYDIALEVTDRIGLKSRAQAILTVKLAPRAEVWLATPAGETETGDTLRFSGGTRPALTDTQYKFIFADGKETEWLSRAEAQHDYEKPGGYSVQLIARRAGLVLGQTSKKINVTQAVYTVMLKRDRANARAGEPLTFRAAVTPAAGNLEYQFDFGDKHQTAWSPNATATHSYARDGTYAARAAIRVKTRRVVQSAPAPIRIDPAAASWWPWLGAGAALVAAAGAVYYRRWRAAPLLLLGLAVLPMISSENPTVRTQGTVHSGWDITIEAQGPPA